MADHFLRTEKRQEHITYGKSTKALDGKGGLYALVFGAFPVVRVIQDRLDGARPWKDSVDGEKRRYGS